MSNIDFGLYSAVFHYSNNDILHYGILGMKWGVRRYQNPDGSLTSAGKKRKRKQLVKDVNDFNSGSPLNKNYNEKHEKNREKLLNNETIKEEATKLKNLKQKRDDEFQKMVKSQIDEYRDFIGSMNVVRNSSFIKNHDMKHYNKGVQKYRDLADSYAKKQGWKSIEEKISNQGVGNIDDLWDEIKWDSKEWINAHNRYDKISKQYNKAAESLAESVLKDCNLKRPTLRQKQTMMYALNNVKL